jgi:hypothetical protein
MRLGSAVFVLTDLISTCCMSVACQGLARALDWEQEVENRYTCGFCCHHWATFLGLRIAYTFYVFSVYMFF